MVRGEGGRLFEGDDSREIPSILDASGESEEESDGRGEEGEEADEGPEDKFGVFKVLRLT
jgi:hypothetical protein